MKHYEQWERFDKEWCITLGGALFLLGVGFGGVFWFHFGALWFHFGVIWFHTEVMWFHFIVFWFHNEVLWFHFVAKSKPH